MSIYHWLVIIGVFVSSCSQLLLKESASIQYQSKISEILNFRVILSYAIFFCSVLLNIYCLSKGVMIKDIPIMESTGYIFVPLLSMFYLSEKITFRTILSLILIILGIVIFYI